MVVKKDGTEMVLFIHLSSRIISFQRCSAKVMFLAASRPA